jgi:hypothetical protein
MVHDSADKRSLKLDLIGVGRLAFEMLTEKQFCVGSFKEIAKYQEIKNENLSKRRFSKEKNQTKLKSLISFIFAECQKDLSFE